jgi:hypothetical protein
MAEFSDPQWWPKPPPKPPTPITLRMIVGSVLPLAVVVAGVALIVTQRGSHAAKTVQSVAAYEQCLRSHGGAAAGGPGGAARQAQHACQSFLPPGVSVGSYQQQDPQQAAVEQCIRNAQTTLPGHGFGGRLGGGPSPALRAAVQICQGLARGSAPAPAQTPTSTTQAGPPKA